VSDGHRRRRDRYRIVGPAIRRAIAALLSDRRTSEGEYRVFLAILHDVASYSRLGDRVSRRRLSEVARVTQRTVSRALARLAERGVVLYEPVHGRGKASRVALPLEETGSDVCPVSASEQAEETGRHVGLVSDAKTGQASTRKRDSQVSEKRDSQVSPSREDLSEKRTPEGGGPDQEPQSADEAITNLVDAGLVDAKHLPDDPVDDRLTLIGTTFFAAIDDLRASTIVTMPVSNPFESERRKSEWLLAAVGDAVDAGLSGDGVLDALFEQKLPRVVERPVGFLVGRCAALERAAERKRQWARRDDGRDEWGFATLGEGE
jgi:DNA-binding transcriptional ArsR family regulator